MPVVADGTSIVRLIAAAAPQLLTECVASTVLPSEASALAVSLPGANLA